MRSKPRTSLGSLEKIIKNEANSGLIVSNFVKLHKVKLPYNTKIQLAQLLSICNVLDFFPLCISKQIKFKIRFSFEARVILTQKWCYWNQYQPEEKLGGLGSHLGSVPACVTLDCHFSFSVLHFTAKWKDWMGIISKIFSSSKSINTWPENSSYIRDLQLSKTWLPYYEAMSGLNELCLESLKLFQLVKNRRETNVPYGFSNKWFHHNIVLGGQWDVVMCLHHLKYPACQTESVVLAIEGAWWKLCSWASAWCH